MGFALSLVDGPTTEPLTIAEAKRQLRMGASAGEPAPTAPTVALAGAGAGNCDNGAHRVGITIGTADGETEIGPLSDTVTVVDKTSNGKIAVSAITLGGSAATYRRVWLVPVAGGSARLAATINDNTTTVATLSIADASLGVAAPTTNTTADPEITRRIIAVREEGEAITHRAFITQTWDLFLDEFPCEDFIEVPKPPLISVTYVKYYDTGGTLRTLTANTDYIVQAPAGPRCRRGRIALPFSTVWPVPLSQMGAVCVRFVAGYGAASAVPRALKDAMLLRIGTLDLNREDVVTGTIAAKLPGTADDLYRRFISYPTQRRAA